MPVNLQAVPVPEGKRGRAVSAELLEVLQQAQLVAREWSTPVWAFELTHRKTRTLPCPLADDRLRLRFCVPAVAYPSWLEELHVVTPPRLDFQCPSCRLVLPLGDTVRLVYGTEEFTEDVTQRTD
jgi:hypothetical protein